MNMKYQTVIDFIKQVIGDRNLKPGSKLPSILEISKKMQCNKSTVIRAYNELEKEHAVFSVPKSGYYLVSKKEQQKCMTKTDCIDFYPYIFSNKVVPDIELQHCLNQSISLYGDKMLTVDDVSGGIESLRKVIQKQLQNLQVFTSANNIFVTTGSQQSLSILLKTPFPNRKNKVLVEQPTCPEILSALDICGAETVGIERDQNGIDFERLENLFKNEEIKFFYTMPRFHNPTGFSYTVEQKRKILKLAQQYNVYIIEDDCFAELDLNRKADPMFSEDSSSMVFYVKSYSKILFPWLRLGIIVFPSNLSSLFRGLKICSDIIEQGALELFIKNGMYDKHIKRIKHVYKARMNMLKNACGKYLTVGISASIPDTGCFACIKLPENIPAHSLVRSLAAHNVKIATADNAYLPPCRKPNCIFLNIRNVDESQIEQGIKMMSEELEKIMKSSTGDLFESIMWK